MAGFLQHLRSGDWLTAERIRGYSIILLVIGTLGLTGWIAMADGLIDRNGKPIGTDFSNVYAAGVLTLDGKAAGAYDPQLQHAAEKQVFGRDDVPFFGWHYPPFFLLAAAALATLPYALALFAWMALTIPLYLASLRAICTGTTFPSSFRLRDILLVAAAFPAVFVNLGHGQNGFLTTALLGGALVLLDRRPIIAGVLIGLLAYKPQFGVLIPLVLLVTWRWRVIAAATATIAALALVSTALLGMGVWHAFAASAEYSRVVVLEAGATGWEKIQSLFSAVRALGGSVHIAYAAQGMLMLALAASLVWLWRSRAAYELKAAALALACLLATPYVLDYDFAAMAVAIAFLVRHGAAHGFRGYEITLLALAWIMPLIARTVMSATGVPLGLIVLLTLYGLTLRRALQDVRMSTHQAAQLANA
ncbi:membrane protein [Afipia sp. P52-10]|uniref:glycosyltransferase family 87 protein n=1 Tax=Afipia sp. P52-10 TaxID=1429916 RepID=UPI0003DF426C|nr:glycosyltransferase family 87 protein [Afipia sp. P52-10]ETR77028.1 membrane protein [Afipia sp. P52-10]